MPEPMTREQYAAALANLDEHIANVDTDACGDFTEDGRRVEYAILGLTEAVLACAKGIRLLAEPPPVDVVAAPGQFTLIEHDETGDPR